MGGSTPGNAATDSTLEERLDRIESLLVSLVEKERVREFYSVEEFAVIVRRAPFTCRAWFRQGRILAVKKASGRGKFKSWAVAHAELLRYQREGLLPVR
jgi:hypothetical protein